MLELIDIGKRARVIVCEIRYRCRCPLGPPALGIAYKYILEYTSVKTRGVARSPKKTKLRVMGHEAFLPTLYPKSKRMR